MRGQTSRSLLFCSVPSTQEAEWGGGWGGHALPLTWLWPSLHIFEGGPLSSREAGRGPFPGGRARARLTLFFLIFLFFYRTTTETPHMQEKTGARRHISVYAEEKTEFNSEPRRAETSCSKVPLPWDPRSFCWKVSPGVWRPARVLTTCLC